MRILIADDLMHVHKYIDKMIHWDELGIREVYHAYDGQEAIHLIEEKDINILITDIKMPLVDGIQLISYIKEKDLDIKIIVLSAYNEFDYAREALKYGAKDYLLKPVNHRKLVELVSKLMNEIYETQKAIIQQMIPQIILSNDKVKNNNELVQALHLLGIESYFAAVLTYEDKSFDIEDTNTICWNIASNKKFVLFLSNDTSIIHKKTNANNDSFVMGISNVKSISDNIFRSYEEANHALLMNFYKKIPIHYHGDIEFQYSIDEDKINDTRKKLIECLQYNYQKERITKLIDILILYFVNNKVYPKMVQHTCYKLLLIINEEYKKMVSTKNDYVENDFSYIEYLDNIASIKDNFKKEIYSIMDKNMHRNEKTNEQLIDEIITYIHDNYDKKLSLDSLSSKFYINKYNISREFKRIKDINLKDYIVKVRMEKAALLLQNTQLRIYEIAHLVGYSSEAHFSSGFKKYWGIAPKELQMDKTKIRFTPIAK